MYKKIYSAILKFEIDKIIQINVCKVYKMDEFKVAGQNYFE